MDSGALDIGAVGDFANGEPQRINVGGRSLMVVRQGDRFFALRDRCAHQGARLSLGCVGGTALPCRPGDEIELGRIGEIVVCPWHGWEYDLATGRSVIDQNVRVASYEVIVEGDRLLVEL